MNRKSQRYTKLARQGATTKSSPPQKKSSRSFHRKKSQRRHVSPHRPAAKVFQSPAAHEAAWQKTTRTLKSLQAAQRPPQISARPEALTLDPWQQQAVAALNSGDHVVVDAPTTAGKTRVVEVYLQRRLQDTSFDQACYTCPVKSLANDKYRELKEMFGAANVGITTGDLKHNSRAPIVIATLESYRNSLLGRESSLRTDLVIFDEYHYIQDYSRGSAWEEAMILSSAQTQLLLLSASVNNPGDFVQWLKAIHNRSAILIQTHHRPVPLKHLIFDGKYWILEENLPKNLPAATKPSREFVSYRVLQKSLRLIQQLELSPTIIYTGKRRSTEKIAKILAHSLPPLDPAASAKITASLSEVLGQYACDEMLDPRFRKLIEHTGIAYHHSGLTPGIRASIETLLKDGILRICVATSGLSLGINFSVKSTMLADHKRPGDLGMTPYSSSDVLQMTGRAGRRGKDKVGFSLWPTLEFYQAMAHTTRDAIRPRLRYDPSTFLGLIDKGFDLRTVEDLYNRSFDKFHSSAPPSILISSAHLATYLAAPAPLPCRSTSAMHSFMIFQRGRGRGVCGSCEVRRTCHAYIRNQLDHKLVFLQYHLHTLGALNHLGALSSFGKIAKFLPHAGGLIVARLITNETKVAQSIARLTEVMACFSLAYYKSPYINPNYRLPVKRSYLMTALRKMYPEAHFPYLYEQKITPSGGATQSFFIEFHPGAGDIIRQWIGGAPWSQLVRNVTNAYFAEGDLFSFIYKIANYLQSLHQARLGELSDQAGELRHYILRAPLDFSTYHHHDTESYPSANDPAPTPEPPPQPSTMLCRDDQVPEAE